MKQIQQLLTIAVLVLLGFTAYSQDDIILQGEKLFINNCAACHKIDADGQGPKLNSALDNWGGNKEAMYVWVRNYANALKNAEAGVPGFERALEVIDYDPKVNMNQFPTLTDDKLDAIFAYVDNGPIEPPPPPPGEEGSAGNNYLNWILLAILGIFILLALILAQISSNLERVVAEKEGEELPEAKPLFERVFNRTTMSVLSLIAVGIIGFVAYHSAANLGRSKGYAPEQPIAFSHKLHAGTLEIDCQYCHTSAAVSKSSAIPATNVCMNCHVQVAEGPKTGKKEIAKIYAAAGYNPETRQYDLESTGPVEWKRIHNLPDHVFFSHAQHVSAGQIECQTCHGEVQEMEVLKQHSSLSMGWCIDCHRQTKVQFTENAYYEDLFKEYHDKMNKDGDKYDKNFFVTVEKIGGTECQKCHY